MPTENRSSNTEMVSVPRKLLVRASSTELGMTAKKDRMSAKAEIRSILAQPAEQHQGEPVAWLAKTLKGALAGTLGFVRPFNRLNPDLYEGPFPVFRHADPGEVERLRETIEQLGLERRVALRGVERLEKERDTLRAQLAERDALMARVVDHANFWHDHPYAEVVEAIAKDYKALSASTEPQVKS